MSKPAAFSARLHGARLHGARLRGARLFGARLFAAGCALIAVSALALVAPFQAARAQTVGQGTATPQATITGPSNAVQGTFFACPDAVGLQFTGTLLTGFDIYYQAFSGAVGTTALTSLRQVVANGTFTVSERVPLAAGTTLAAGASASARVLVAREGNSSNIDFEFTLTDIQDGCGNLAPTGAAVSVDAGSGASGTTASTSSAPVTGANLFAPGGITLNPNLQIEPTVVVGARPSENFRSQTPGLLFAACNNDPLALPGLVYDNDNVTVYWSWFTRTLEQMQDHLATAQYSVRMNGAIFPNVIQSEPERRGGRFYTFYSAPVGFLRPGHYEIEYRVTWSEPHFDGFDEFGPGTANPVDAGNCNFNVTLNPTGVSPDHTEIFFPTLFPVHNIFRD